MTISKADARKGITTQAGLEMAEKGFTMDREKADENKDGTVDNYEQAKAEAVQKDEVLEMYHGGMACGSDEGLMSDPVSGNPIPLGSSAENVRDDISAMISEGEYVLPAHVVKWHGLAHIMEMQAEAEAGLMAMEMDGLIQYGKKNPIAKALRTPKFRMRVVPSKKKPKRHPKHKKLRGPE